MNALIYQRAITDAERRRIKLVGMIPKEHEPDYRAGVAEGMACVWLRSKGIEPPAVVGGAVLRAKSLGWKQ